MMSNYIIRQDGDQYFASTDNFINLQESDVEWGATPEDALVKLLSEIQTMKHVAEGNKHNHWDTPEHMIDRKYLNQELRTYDDR